MRARRAILTLTLPLLVLAPGALPAAGSASAGGGRLSDVIDAKASPSVSAPRGSDHAITRTTWDGRTTAVRPATPVAPPPAVRDVASQVGSSDHAAVSVARAQLAPYVRGFGARPRDLAVARVTRSATSVVVVLQQMLGGRPVLGAQISVWLDRDGSLRAVLGKASASHATGFPTPSAALASKARHQAADAVAVRLPSGASASGLRVRTVGRQWWDPSILSTDMVSRVVPVAVQQVTTSTGGRWRVLSHIPTARALVAWSIDPSIRRLVCDAARTIPRDTQTGVRCGTGQPYAVTRAEGQGPVANADVNAVYDFFGDTSTFYAGLGVDLTALIGADYNTGDGKALRATVRICQALQCPYGNAFWNGEQMAFGEGVTTDDITGHELSHGVTQHLAPLTYLWQAGAINESLSDIFGEFVDLGNGSADDTAANRWLLGEGSSLGAIRSLKDPTAFNDPDRMRSPLWAEDRNMLDNGAVHTDSGVGNKAAYLLSDGGTFNGVTVSGLGVDQAAALFESARVALPTGADYGLLAEALRASCTSLALSSAQCADVDKALQATEMDLGPAGGYPSRAPVCDAGASVGQTAGTTFATTAGFSLDARSWKLDSTLGDYAYSRDGDGSAAGVLRTPGAYSMEMKSSVLVPPGKAYFRMTHAYALVTGSIGIPLKAGFVSMEYSTNNGSSWSSAAGLPWVGGPNDSIKKGWVGSSGGWQTSRLDLSSLAGQPVRLRWTTNPSGTVPGAWWIDDASIYTCVG